MTALCRSLLEAELKLYDEEHASTFVEGKSKSKDTGHPILLEAEGSEYGVLLMHGYLAQPEEVRPFAEFLHSKGYSVFVPRLPGHGTTPEDLMRRSREEWYQASRRGYRIIRECAAKVIVCGFSMGAGLALLNASRHRGDFCAVVSVSAPVHMKGWALCHARFIHALQRLSAAVGLRLIPALLDHHPENREINYLQNPVRGVAQLSSLMRLAADELDRITLPVCAIQADDDPVIKKDSLDYIVRKVKSSVKERHLLKGNVHGIVRGCLSNQVFEMAARFIEKVRALES